jgi:predicted MFS family arabinose efflux permease
VRLERDRLTWLTYLQLGSYGYFLYGFGPSVSLLRDDQGVSRSVAGLHGTALALGALLSALVVAPLVLRLGRTAVVWSGLATMCAGIVTYTAATALPVTLAGAFVAAFGGSFVVVSSAPVLSDHHGASGPSAISEANAVAAGVGTVAPLVIGGAVAVGIGWRPAMLVLVPVVLALAVAGRGVRSPRPVRAATHDERPGRLPGRYWVSWVVVTAGIAVEFCLVLWTADVLRDQVGLSPAAAAAGVTALVAGMCAGRVGGGRLALRRSVDSLLYGAVLTTAAGFTAFWLTGSVWVALPALVVCGLGISLFYPLGIARAIAASDGRPDLASARAGLGAALASGAGPFVLGAVADVVGLHWALLVVPALLMVAAAGIRFSRPRFGDVPPGQDGVSSGVSVPDVAERARREAPLSACGTTFERTAEVSQDRAAHDGGDQR